MRAPHPHVLAAHLERVAKTLRAQGVRAQELAPVWADRGTSAASYDGDGRTGNEATSPVERAALAPGGRWGDDLDRMLAQRMRFSWLITLRLEEIIDEITSHAGDDDPLPAGSGTCVACDHICRPDNKPGDRLRSGLCPADYRAWHRAGQPDRAGWVRGRRDQLGLVEREAG